MDQAALLHSRSLDDCDAWILELQRQVDLQRRDPYDEVAEPQAETCLQEALLAKKLKMTPIKPAVQQTATADKVWYKTPVLEVHLPPSPEGCSFGRARPRQVPAARTGAAADAANRKEGNGNGTRRTYYYN